MTAWTLNRLEIRASGLLELWLAPSDSTAGASPPRLRVVLKFLDDTRQTLHAPPTWADDTQDATAERLLQLPWRPQSSPLTHLRVRVAPDAEASLAGLLVEQPPHIWPTDDSSLLNHFLLIKHRWGDCATVHFLMGQVLSHYQGDAGLKASAAIVLAYKAVEMMTPTALEDAWQQLSTAEQAMAGLPFNAHPRKNPEHLRQAVLVAQWHLALAMQDSERFKSCLASAWSRTHDLTNYSTAGIPASRSLCLSGWFYLCSGNAEWAKRDFSRILALNALALRDADRDKAILFEELRSLHRATMLAGRCLAGMANSLPAGREVDSETVFNQVCRITGPVGHQLQATWQAWTAPHQHAS